MTPKLETYDSVAYLSREQSVSTVQKPQLNGCR